MINIAICDDEEIYIREIQKYIGILQKKHNGIIEVFCFLWPEELLKKAEKIYFDYVFLDIRLRQENGFDIAKRLMRNNKELRIFFVSNYEEYVFDSFAYNPPKFIRKSKMMEDMKYSIELLDKWIINKISTYEFFEGRERRVICLGNLLYVISEGNYLKFFMNNGQQHKIRMTVKEFMNDMDKTIFFRINAGCIINMHFIRNIDKKCVVMEDGRQFGISRGNFMEFRKCYSLFCMQ